MSIMADYTARNRGIITDLQQYRLEKAVVAIAGCGGDGGQLAETLARMGVCNFRLADPEVFSVENLNRQAGCYHSTLGVNKAEVVAERIWDINPSASVKLYIDGVTESNLDLFLSGASIVADEMEYTEHRLAVMLAREARLLSIPNIMAMNVAFGCLVTSFHPNGLTVEEFLGINPDAPINEIASIPRLPGYAESDVVAKVASGEIPAPSVAVGVQLAAGYAAFEVLNYICNRRKPLVAPEVFWADAQEMSSGILTIDVPVAS
jgi:molybdopterin/thiamine biosynthesis adenylyltransferase